jgi:hypothetical protein
VDLVVILIIVFVMTILVVKATDYRPRYPELDSEEEPEPYEPLDDQIRNWVPPPSYNSHRLAVPPDEDKEPPSDR